MAEVTLLEFEPRHNVCAFLDATHRASVGFRNLLNFLNQSRLHYALTANPVIFEQHIRGFWDTATFDADTRSVQATVMGEAISITEDTVRQVLQFGEDANTAIEFSSAHILEVFRACGYIGGMEQQQIERIKFCPEWKLLIHIFQYCLSKRKAGFNDIALLTSSAIVGLINREPFNMSAYIFHGIISNIRDGVKNKFLMYPRFLQLIIDNVLPRIPRDGPQLILGHHKPAVFSNMKRRFNPPKYEGPEVPVFPWMLDPTLDPPIAPDLNAQPGHQLAPQHQIDLNEPVIQDVAHEEAGDIEMDEPAVDVQMEHNSDEEGNAFVEMMPGSPPQGDMFQGEAAGGHYSSQVLEEPAASTSSSSHQHTTVDDRVSGLSDHQLRMALQRKIRKLERLEAENADLRSTLTQKDSLLTFQYKKILKLHASVVNEQSLSKNKDKLIASLQAQISALQQKNEELETIVALYQNDEDEDDSPGDAANNGKKSQHDVDDEDDGNDGRDGGEKTAGGEEMIYEAPFLDQIMEDF